MSSTPPSATPSDVERIPIWYAMTALEQEIAYWAQSQHARDAKLVADLMHDAWAQWDEDWKLHRSSYGLMQNFLDRIAVKTNSGPIRDQVSALQMLIESYRKKTDDGGMEPG